MTPTPTTQAAPLVTTTIPMRGPGGRFAPVFRVTQDGVQVGIFPTAAAAWRS